MSEHKRLKYDQAEIPSMEPIITQYWRDVNAQIEDNMLYVVKSALGFHVDRERLLQALTDAKAFYEEGYRAAMRSRSLEEKFKDAFGSIAWYNGHLEWLWELADKLEAKEDGFFNCLAGIEWLSDRHALWMLLVGMFGNWGTSIRCGWIEDRKAAAAFIRESTQEYRDALEEEAEHEC